MEFFSFKTAKASRTYGPDFSLVESHSRSRPMLGSARTIRVLRRQAGYLLLEVGLALLISSIAGILAYKTSHRADLATMAMTQGDNLANVAHAAETLVFESYESYQAGLPITRNGVTLAFGTAPGQSMTPTLDNLRGMAVGITPGSNFGNYKTLNDATYITSIQRIPAGCELTPNGQTCNITGLVCMDRPVQDYGAPVNETDDFAIGKMVGKIGGDGGTSIAGSAGTITGAGGAWSEPNPFAGTPVGIVCARFGFGSAAFGNFLRVRDTRDPRFQNNLTADGNISTTGGTVGAGTGNPGPGECRLGEILASGAFLSRSATCIRRAWVDGNAGEAGVADAAGTTRAILKDNGEILSMDAAGVVKAGFTYTGTESNVKADNVLNNAGNAGLRPNGEAFSGSVVINTSAAPGGACPTADAMVWGTGTSSLRLLKCVAGLWTTTGATVGNIGGACTTNGELGETPTKVSIICVGNAWQTTTSRMGSWAVSNQYFVGHGSVVPKPTCGSGSTPKIIAVPKGINTTYALQNFDVTDNGPSWTISMWGPAIGSEIAWGTAIAQVGCWYP